VHKFAEFGEFQLNGVMGRANPGWRQESKSRDRSGGQQRDRPHCGRSVQAGTGDRSETRGSHEV